jgi:hypothetical protein
MPGLNYLALFTGRIAISVRPGLIDCVNHPETGRGEFRSSERLHGIDSPVCPMPAGTSIKIESEPLSTPKHIVGIVLDRNVAEIEDNGEGASHICERPHVAVQRL